MKTRKSVSILLLALWLILPNMGCVKQKLAGDDDINLIKTKKAEVNATGIKEAEVDAQGILGAQIGLINKTLNDMRDTSSGRDSISNSPDMIIKVVGITAGAIAFCILTLIFIFMKMLGMIKHLVDNVSDSLDNIIDKDEQI